MSFVIAPLARADLKEVLNYIRGESPQGAKRVRSAILAAARQLGETPGMGHVRTDLTSRPLRFLTVRSRFLIAYKEVPGGVEIVRVFGPGRDVAALLG